MNKNLIVPSLLTIGVIFWPYYLFRQAQKTKKQDQQHQKFLEQNEQMVSNNSLESSQIYQSQKCIGIEVGGTGIYIGYGIKYFNSDGKVVRIEIKEKKYFRTHQTEPDVSINEICEFIQKFEFQSLGIASFGPLCLNKNDPDYGNITKTPKVGWQNYPLVKKIAEKLKINPQKIGFDTDVNACGLAEARLGNHLNVRNNLIYITIGTGVGVGIIMNGEPVHGLMHPEGGHMLIPKHKKDENYEGSCIFHKNCLEGMVNNLSIAKRKGFKDVMEVGNLKDDDEIWDIIAYYLSVFCANLAYVCSPEVIVLGGGIMKRKILYEKIANKLEDIFNGYPVLYKKSVEDFICAPKCVILMTSTFKYNHLNDCIFKKIIWQSENKYVGQEPFHLRMQDDGNCVIYDKNLKALWTTGIWFINQGPWYLKIENNGQLILYGRNNNQLWKSHDA
ncbi:Bulb-type lectin domain [Pseudocohnilembus persalinus]|uniref:fructokinase n=1 Tax=Pseudocohnilembus persalinus TaxID=266149 RepID=A0A0V0QX09_PSEPJ|nr:Bulb-type lectin domain [Pseudocohnilembus persalinus]|eukprot:KRX06621.1 Bulb-type lectin domain [Pseudocohnilembus persalinus]